MWRLLIDATRGARTAHEPALPLPPAVPLQSDLAIVANLRLHSASTFRRYIRQREDIELAGQRVCRVCRMGRNAPQHAPLCSGQRTISE